MSQEINYETEIYYDELNIEEYKLSFIWSRRFKSIILQNSSTEIKEEFKFYHSKIIKSNGGTRKSRIFNIK